MFQLKHLKSAVAASALAVAGITAAQAQGPLDLLPDLHWASDAEIGRVQWTGFIFNPDIGYETLNTNGSGGRNIKDGEGWKVGGEIGYDKQFGSVVVGVAGDLFKTFIQARGERTPDHIQSDLQLYGSLRARLGVDYGRFLFYGTGGASIERLKVDRLPFGGPNVLSDVKTQTGWAGGGGVEYVYNKSLTLRVEYIHYDFGDATYTSLPAGAGKLETSIDAINVGLVSRF